jgi:hypothetical protein
LSGEESDFIMQDDMNKMTGTNGGRVSPRDFIGDKNSDQSAEFAGEIQDDRNKRVPKISYITIDFQSIVWRRK